MSGWDNIAVVQRTGEENLGQDRVPPLYPHQPTYSTDSRDDVDLEDLIRDMHNELSLSRLPLLTHEERCRLSPPHSCSSLCSSGSSSEEELQVELRHRSASTAATLSPPLHLRKHKQDLLVNRSLPKSISLPLHQVPEPFPEVTQSPISPAVSMMLSEGNSRSSPSSPLVRRARKGRRHCPDSPDGVIQEPVWKPQTYKKLMLTFYNSDVNYKTVMVDPSMKVSDVCHLLVLKNQAVDDKSWAIVEKVIQKNYTIERTLEDHELVTSVQDLWVDKDHSHNRFLFKKDFTKYAIFQNPAQLFPMYMLEAKGDLPQAESDRQRNIILQNVFSSPDLLPDIQGYMHMKDGKRSWKKHFCVLRKSGLYYSSKGTSKDGKHLVLASTFENVDIYVMENAKKCLHAPNNFCICLKPTRPVHDTKDLLCFCAEDVAAKNCWLAGCRLVKYGTQLRENYKHAVKRDNKLRSIENRQPEDLMDNDKVALDFTGQSGKVIIDPTEALGVAVAEAQMWKKKAQYRGGRSPLGETSPDGSPRSVSMHGISSGIHMTQPWFYSGISREDAVRIITDQGLIDGLFLVRESRNIPGTFVLSLAHAGKVLHCQIVKIEEDGQVFVSPDHGHTKFSDLIQLVEFYQLNAGGLPCRLSNYAHSFMS